MAPHLILISYEQSSSQYNGSTICAHFICETTPQPCNTRTLLALASCNNLYTMAARGNAATNQTNCSYDVFLSFRGEDTRHSFTGYLYQALSRTGLNIFMDDEGLQGGDQIKPSLDNAIQQSRSSIVVLSENYASSTWCLDELVKILECMGSKNQKVWPIFYKVAPSAVRHRRNSYAEAMAEHEKKFGDGSDKVQKWRSALAEVANLKGWHYETGYESKLIEKIAKKATTKLQREQLDIGEHIIGLQSGIEEVKSLLDIESHQTVFMLGIHGIGGMGKTTLAKALYNSIIHHFECAVFLECVREKSNSYKGLEDLQRVFISKLFVGEDINLSSVSEGVKKLKKTLQKRRVLLVLDDVDRKDQLEKLAGNCDWFGSGSRIIITTRDKHVLGDHEVAKTFEMKGLNYDEALQLFSWNAFKKSKPRMNYKEVSNRVVQYASGLPLALKVIGSHLANKSVEACKDALQQYEKIPDKKIQEILKISYDCLEDLAKCIFLDIACFFKGQSLGYVEQVWKKCDFSPLYNVGILVDKSLITIENDKIWMHDLIQDMGKEIVRLEDSKNPGRRSRLYFHQDVLKVLRENLGSDQIEGIMLNPPEVKEVIWNDNAFRKMTNLRILIIRKIHFTQELDYLPNSLKLLDWEGYPSKSLPSGFDHSDIVVLRLPYSYLTLEKAKSFPKLMHLTRLNFSKCQYITHFPDVSGVPNLSELDLSNCGDLTAIHHSVGFLQKLKHLAAWGCNKLQDFPPRMSLPSLQYLNLCFTRIAFFPHIEERMCAPLTINLSSSQIKELPDSIGNLEGLRMIDMKFIRFTVGGLPSELFMLPNMWILILDSCGVAVRESLRGLLNSHAMATTGPSTLNEPPYCPLRVLSCYDCGLTDEDLEIILSCFPNLEELVIPHNKFVSLPASIEGFGNYLRRLDVSNCRMLEEIPELPKSIKKLNASGCPRLSSEALKRLWSQVLNEAYELCIGMPGITNIPDWFDHHCKGGIVSFWARRKFPVLAIAFILGREAWTREIKLHINGDLCKSGFYPGPSTAVSIFDLQGLFSYLEWSSLETFLVREWNHVEIETTCQYQCYDGETWNVYNCNVRSCGAYVYKQETNMEDIRFTCPSLLKRTLSMVDDGSRKRNCGEEAQA